jgi:HSP20 family molecular chaperone IbpA
MSATPHPNPFWAPRNDVFVSKEGAFTVELDLCGLQRGDFEVRSEGNKLMIRGDRRREEIAAALGLLVTEILAGPFESVFEVPAEFDLSRKSFSHVDGVLRISVPRVSTGTD